MEEPPLTFGGWLVHRRKALSLTREQLARRVDCSVSALRKIEAGDRRPSVQIAQLLANALDLPPAARATSVQVARGELSLERLPLADWHSSATAQAPSPSRAPSDRLPTNPTPLIGRQAELAELVRLLADPQCRLLTLVGPGGVGKTRLAIRAARLSTEAYADGAAFVPLAPLTAASFIVPAVAQALGHAFTGPMEPQAQLLHFLRDKQLLLVLDNIEHLLAAGVADVLTDLLECASGIKLLVTSREVLNLQAEWTFEVQGLPVPAGLISNEAVAGEAVELFLQRARRANVGFVPTAEDYVAIGHICQLVEGLPLAIELAAAWVRVLSCQEIAAELERSLDILYAKARDVPSRHRSMQTVFDHSWKLLADEEQAALCRLAVFQGGFTRAAAEYVAGASLAVLSALIAKSLLRRAESGRYELHELIRQYAAVRLAEQANLLAETQARHGRYILTWFGDQLQRLTGPDQPIVLAELGADIGNFRLAWAWAADNCEFALISHGLRVVGVLYDIRGWLQEGLGHLDRAAEALEAYSRAQTLDRQQRVLVARLSTYRGLNLFRRGQHHRAHRALMRSLDSLRPLAATAALVEALTYSGIVTYLLGDYAQAQRHIDEGLAAAQAVGDEWFQALCITNQGIIARVQGQNEEAYERLQAAVTAWRAIGDPRFTAFGLNFFGLSAIALGHAAEAQTVLAESLALNTTVGDRWGLGTAHRNLGLAAQRQGDHARAQDSFRQSLHAFGQLGAQWDLARTLADYGRTAAALGLAAEAEEMWRDAASGPTPAPRQWCSMQFSVWRACAPNMATPRWPISGRCLLWPIPPAHRKRKIEPSSSAWYSRRGWHLRKPRPPAGRLAH
jgi:predicted ATPase/DNA-binding XRE family transcriptional regulator/Tfp pilus assembly protein PilF